MKSYLISIYLALDGAFDFRSNDKEMNVYDKS